MIEVGLPFDGSVIGVLVVAQVASSGLVFDAVVRIIGFVVLSGAVAAGVSFVYRWYSREVIPDGVAVLTGVVAVALWLNTQTVLQDAIIGDADVLDPSTAVYTVGAFAASAVAADGGRRVGDHLASRTAITTPRGIDDVSELVRTAGRVVAVEIPTEIDDADGFDPVAAETKTAIAGRTFRFPRRVTVGELQDRLAARLEADYGIGYVDVELTPDGTVERLAVGSKPAGLGPTLAPGTVAVAVRGDPAPDASPGDAVDVWIGDDTEQRRITTGEFRASVDDVATITLPERAADALAVDREYRLVTRPGTVDDEREFRALLRTTPETVTSVAIGADDALAGDRVGSIPAIVLAIDAAGSSAVVAFPDPDRRLETGDVCYVLAHPSALGRLGER